MFYNCSDAEESEEENQDSLSRVPLIVKVESQVANEDHTPAASTEHETLQNVSM